MTNAALATTLVGVGVTSYLAYKAYFSEPDREDGSFVHIVPSVGPTSVGFTGLVTF